MLMHFGRLGSEGSQLPDSISRGTVFPRAGSPSQFKAISLPLLTSNFTELICISRCGIELTEETEEGGSEAEQFALDATMDNVIVRVVAASSIQRD